MCTSQSVHAAPIVQASGTCPAISPTQRAQVMILSQDMDRGRMSLSTKKLEPTPGDMLRDPQKVYDQADEMAKSFRERLAQAEAVARQEGAF